MTLSNGNALAKVKKQADGTWALVTGELAHVFEIVSDVSSWTTDSGSTRLYVQLRELE